MKRPLASVSDEELLARLRRALACGFVGPNNYLVFEEVAWRFNQQKKELEAIKQ